MTFPMPLSSKASSETTAPPGAEPSTQPNAAPLLPRAAERCLRCGYQWFSRTADPVRCPHCGSKSWNQPRAYKIQGKPAPTRKPKPRGLLFTSETAQEASQIRYRGEAEAKADPEKAP